MSRLFWCKIDSWLRVRGSNLFVRAVLKSSPHKDQEGITVHRPEIYRLVLYVVGVQQQLA